VISVDDSLVFVDAQHRGQVEAYRDALLAPWSKQA
jgi:hypothetical protein